MFRFRRRAPAGGDPALQTKAGEEVDAPDTSDRSKPRYEFDPNLPIDEIEVADANSSDVEKSVKVEVNAIEDDSPYPEVHTYSTNVIIYFHDSHPLLHQGSCRRSKLRCRFAGQYNTGVGHRLDLMYSRLCRQYVILSTKPFYPDNDIRDTTHSVSHWSWLGSDIP